MYINQLEIIAAGKELRCIKFHSGLNLIVDQTLPSEMKDMVNTGNGVGKTTVLRLIDYCFGKDAKKIYTDPESGETLSDVKAYLTEQRVLIRLTLSENADEIEPNSKYVIERNFLSGKQKIQMINGHQVSRAKEFPQKIGTDLFGIQPDDKPTFRQVTGRTFRIDSPAIDNTLKFLGKFPTVTEYETLFMYLFGIHLPDRTPIVQQLNTERTFLKRLEATPREQLTLELTKNEDDIELAKQKRASLNVDPEYDTKIRQLDELKYQQTIVANKLTAAKLRYSLIKDAQQQIEETKSFVNTEELKALYGEAQGLIENIQISFEQLVAYNNQMVNARSEFIGRELPQLEAQIRKLRVELTNKKREIGDLTEALAGTNTTKDLEQISEVLGQLYETKGRVSNSIEQIDRSRDKVTELQHSLEDVDGSAFSEATHDLIHQQLQKFNRYFSTMSEDMYGEPYGVTFEQKSDSKKKYYSFYVFSYNNSSSGKKQGEIAAFDLGYIQFARDENIPVLDFILYDKKELMHGNQLVKIAEEAEQQQIQILFPILSDKLPSKLDEPANIVLRLSQDDKLFRF
ncbi:DNA double-strand break repair ATPase [Lactiplantibacillus pentosus KCA1]|nr:DUF2326 domain-containing protein [Lactiplantibacillus pentosus]EIW14363.1 DNA double-strand break repair ATPase [Lactiplantibacillus pentosus KCA1]